MKKKVTTLATVALLSSAAYATIASADIYTVQKGDTLTHVARSYSTTVTELKRLNGLSTDLIYPKQKLTVASTSVQPAAPKPSTPAPTSSTTTNGTYKIVPGDTLSAIALKHKMTLSDLKRKNKLTSNMIYPGQTLIVAATASPPPTTGSTENRPAPAPNPVPTPVTQTGSDVVYTIKVGDTLGKIASLYGMSLQQLKSINNLSSDIIYAGKTLKVSGQTSPIESAPVSSAQSLIQEAKKLLGTPYVWGGSTVSGFDCSGFIYYVFNKTGQNYIRTSAEGYFNRSYYVDKPQPGDLVFFENTYKKGISHIGIYLGNNEFIHAGDKAVEISNLNSPYYQKHFDSFKRFY
jgi:cell wall-associated NlpC family hydrolase